MKRTFTGKTRIFLAVSGIIIAAALVMQICGVGLNLGIDFTGGSLLTYSVGESYDVEDVYEILEAAGYTEYQVTKTEPSEASINLRSELAAEEAAAQAAADEAAAEAAEEAEAEATEESADETAGAEATAEPVEEVADGILDTDKSGIQSDGLTDLQIRLDLVDETSELDKNIADGLKHNYPDAELVSFESVTNIMANENDYDSVYAGGYVAEFDMGAEFDADAATADIEAALTGAGYSVKAISGVAFDPEADAAAEATEEPAEGADDESSGDETTDETAEDAEEDPEEAVETGTSLRVLVAVDDQTTQVRSMIETEMSRKYPDFVFVTIDHVSAVAGSDLIANAVKALLIAFVCMLIYIAIRFDFYSGVVALGALIHDVLIMCAFMVFFRGVYQTNSPFIAAVLTIVGYSINNTIIVFDRIRENAKKPGQTMMKKIDVVEMSVRQTLSRTANTTITTLITLVCLYIFGVDSIREFAFPLIVGMLAGTYSSIMLSGQVWAAWVDHRNARKADGDEAEAENV